MKTTFVASCLLASLVASVAAASPAPQAVATSRAAARSGGPQSSESSSQISIVEDNLQVTITTKTTTTVDAEGNRNTNENTETKVLLDGKEVPSNRVRRVGEHLEILDDAGTVIRSVHLPVAHASTGGTATAASGARARSMAKALSAAGASSSASSGKDQQPHLVIAQGPGAPKVMLGVTLDQADEDVAKRLKLNPGDVTVFTAVTPDGPAAKAGIRPLDVAIAVDGQKPVTPERIRELIKAKQPGQTLRLTVDSDGTTRDVDVVLEPFDASKMGQAMSWTVNGAPIGQIDITVDDQMKAMLDQLRAQFKDMDFNVDFDWDTMFAPVPAPGSPSTTKPGAPLYYRFVKPGQATDAGADERIRELEERIQSLNETIRRLEERLGAPAAAPAQPATPTPPPSPRA